MQDNREIEEHAANAKKCMKKLARPLNTRRNRRKTKTKRSRKRDRIKNAKNTNTMTKKPHKIQTMKEHYADAAPKEHKTIANKV